MEKEKEKEKDRLSELPDDILIQIFTKLSFQQVIATSILSTRWRYIKTRFLSLNFHFAFKPFNLSTQDYHEQEDQRKFNFLAYISRVNHAMDSYKSGMHVSNAFRVDMPSLLGQDFDKWVEFALSRKVKIIDLRLDSYTTYGPSSNHDAIANLIPRMCKHSLLNVKELSLTLIFLDDQDIELILSNFIFLEILSIYSPGVQFQGKRLVNPRMVGHCKLTHLNISDASTVKSVEVRDMINLVSLKLYRGLPLMDDLLLDCVPNLVQFEINDDRSHMVLPYILHRISCVQHQLLHLKLSILPNYIESNKYMLPKFKNLKHMVLNVGMANRGGTHQLFRLIEACPSLEKLEIKFSWPYNPRYVHRKLRQRHIKRKKPNYNLKRVRLSGYFGSVSELELAMYVMKNAAALQELIVEACDITPAIRQSAIARATHRLQSVPLKSKQVDQECSNIENELDRLSELPDVILVPIISQPTFQEATATCIISTCWRHLHTCVVPLDLLFSFKPYTFFSKDYPKQKEEREAKFQECISRINHAIDSYNGEDMHVYNAFNVHMPCLGENNNFDKWLDFALSRKVETIDLRIDNKRPYGHLGDCCYDFFEKLFTNTTRRKESWFGVKKLSLGLIYLNDHYFELILSNFEFLEHLSIDSPGVILDQKLVNLKVVGHAKLTHFSLSDVSTIRSIEVRDVINLVSLRFRLLPDKYDLVLESVPSLVHFKNDDGRHVMLPNILHKMSRVRHQIRHLKLSVFPDCIKKDVFRFPKFSNVKHMELKVIMADTFGTHQFFPLIEACPFLEKLEIELWWSSNAKYVERRLDENRVTRRSPKKQSCCLKKVRLSGYFGSVSELELAMYLMNNAVALQEMIVEACDITPEIRQGAIARALRCLQFERPNSVNVVVI